MRPRKRNPGSYRLRNGAPREELAIQAVLPLGETAHEDGENDGDDNQEHGGAEDKDQERANRERRDSCEDTRQPFGHLVDYNRRHTPIDSLSSTLAIDLFRSRSPASNFHPEKRLARRAELH